MEIDEYNQAMLTRLEDLDEVRLQALDHLKLQKLRAEKAYNKRMKTKTFIEGELVMKAILAIELKDPKLGKWFAN